MREYWTAFWSFLTLLLLASLGFCLYVIFGADSSPGDILASIAIATADILGMVAFGYMAYVSWTEL